jgi:long-chain acyl-CoA synthetase
MSLAQRSETVGPMPPRFASVAELFLDGARRTPDAIALRRAVAEGDPQELRYAELGRAIRQIALGLVALGIAPGERVALLAETRPEWTLCDGGIACAGGVVVPVYHTSSPEECRYVLTHSGARAVLVEDAAQLAKIEQIRRECPWLEHVILMLGDARDGVLTLAELRERGAAGDPGELTARVAGIGREDPATIVYTSGTTGPPKGCVLTHANWLATLEMVERRLRLDDQVEIFLFLPLAHALARITQLVALGVGGTLAFWRRDSRTIVEDIAQLRPTHIPTVPRVLEKVHARALEAAGQGSAVERQVFAAALSLGRRRAAIRRHPERRTPPALALAHTLADRAVLRRIRATFGERLEMVLVGAAPIDPAVLAFFDACGVPVLEGYGMTETCAAATVNAPGRVRLGTVGPPLPGVEVRVASDGEVLLRGPNVFPGYWHDEAATQAILGADGWLRTGDLGELDEEGFLRITGRTKDLIITSSGKNVTPSNLEAALRDIPWVSQAVAYGDRRPYLVAALTLDADEARGLAERCGLPPETASLAREPRVRELLEAAVEAVNARFARIEQIKRFAILDHDLSQAAGELTPTMKVKRNVVYERYRDVFDALYEAA